jgi:hypothetical protein
VADLKDVAEGRWYFRQLWVNGERRHRTRVPEEGYYEIAGLPDHHSFAPDYWGADGSFYVNPGDVQLWENSTDIVVLHRWDDERLPIAAFDAETNLVRSSRNAQLSLSRAEEHIAFTAERNILITDGVPAIYGRAGWSVEKRAVKLDLNLYWDVSGDPIRHGNGPQDAVGRHERLAETGVRYSFHRRGSRCRDLANFDFSLGDDSPAFALGFEPIDTSDVGPRPAADREESAALEPYRGA